MFVLTIKSGSKYPDIDRIDYDEIAKITRMNKLKCVYLKLLKNNGESIVIFEDASGCTAKINIMHTALKETSLGLLEATSKSDVETFNKIFNFFDLLPLGKIIGINWYLGDAISYAEKKYPRCRHKKRKKHIRCYEI